MGARVLFRAVFTTAAVAGAVACGGGTNGTARGSASGDAPGGGVGSERTAAASPATESTASSAGGDVASVEAKAVGGVTDANILAVLHEANQGEIDAAQLALASGSNARVLAFAHQMIRDHTKLDQAGDSVAVRIGVTPMLPANDSLGAHGQADLEALRAAGHGAGFDKQYMDAQIADHTTVLALLRRFEGAAQNSQVKAAVSGAMPIVSGHLDRAKRVAAVVGSSTQS
jgi:putative membrane protein